CRPNMSSKTSRLLTPDAAASPLPLIPAARATASTLTSSSRREARASANPSTACKRQSINRRENAAANLAHFFATFALRHSYHEHNFPLRSGEQSLIRRE